MNFATVYGKGEASTYEVQKLLIMKNGCFAPTIIFCD
jgi:hypothetical protein